MYCNEFVFIKFTADTKGTFCKKNADYEFLPFYKIIKNSNALIICDLLQGKF